MDGDGFFERRRLTEDEGDDDRLGVGRRGFIGVSREICDVETQLGGEISEMDDLMGIMMAYRGIIAQYSIEIAEECPGQDRATDGGSLGDDGAVTDGSARSTKGISKDGQEADGRDDALEREKVLNLGGMSELAATKQAGGYYTPWCREYTKTAAATKNTAKTPPSPTSKSPDSPEWYWESRQNSAKSPSTTPSYTDPPSSSAPPTTQSPTHTATTPQSN